MASISCHSEREMVPFFSPMSVYLPVKTGFPEGANNLKAPVWDKFVQNMDILSSQAVESVQP